MSSTKQDHAMRLAHFRFMANKELNEAMEEAAQSLISAATIAWSAQASDSDLTRFLAETCFGGTSEQMRNVRNASEVKDALTNALHTIIFRIAKTYVIDPKQGGEA